MINCTYRAAVEADLGAVGVLGKVVNDLHHQARPDIFAPPSPPERDAAHWRAAILSEHSIGFVAEYSSQVVGFVTAGIAEDNHSMLEPRRFVRVGTVCVAQSCRGQGVGRALMAMVRQWAVEREASDIRLTVWAFNEPARRLYEELGYEIRSLFLELPVARDGAQLGVSAN